MQWGSGSVNISLTLPIVFPTAALQGFCTSAGNNSNNAQVTISTTDFLATQASGSGTINYFVIGY